MTRSAMNRMRRTLQHVSISTQRTARYISKGVMRIFSPAEDNYPETGVQPFQGDPSEE